MKRILTALWFLLTAATLALAEDEAKVKILLEKVTSPDADVRMASRAEAAALGAPVVAALGRLSGQAPDSVKEDGLRLDIITTARLALDRLVHTAGRPGADTERNAVATELEKLLITGTADKVRREALNWLGQIGDESNVNAVARLLGDKDRHVRETARLALERIPGAVAVKALIEAAKTANGDFQNDLIFSLGKKGDGLAAPYLKEIVQGSKGQTRGVALEGLARLAIADSGPIFLSTLSGEEVPERAMIFNEYLRLADNLAALKNSDGDSAMYRFALTNAPADHQRERALLRLCEDSPQGGVEAVLTGLGDPAPRVLNLALARLEGLKGSEVAPTLKRVYEEAKPESRPVLLRALHTKDPAMAMPLIEAAASASEAGLKITALDLAGRLENVALEPLYLEVAEKGSPALKPVGMKGLLSVARKQRAAGQTEQALGIFTRALELATDDKDRFEALRGIVAAGDPKAINTVTGYLKHPILGTEAAKGLVLLAAKLGVSGGVEAAEPHLKKIVTGDFPREVKGQAAEELRKLGRDPQAHLLNLGYVVKWWLVGPMENVNQKGLETKFFPEDVIDLVNEQRIEARKFRWQEYRDVTLDGVIDLIPVFRRSDNRVSYAYTEIESPKEKDVIFRIGSDEGVAVWLNGQRIHFNNATRALKVDEDTVKAHLVAGKNKVLVKIANTAGEWKFVFRVTGV